MILIIATTILGTAETYPADVGAEVALVLVVGALVLVVGALVLVVGASVLVVVGALVLVVGASVTVAVGASVPDVVGASVTSLVGVRVLVSLLQYPQSNLLLGSDGLKLYLPLMGHHNEEFTPVTFGFGPRESELYGGS
mmetsp:Transcript_16978/g.19207  ORF Transcript_16978/g.19207 Transcript_16978/m.19207 type:complete len:139 (-) Transcript_16978:245-661(-)